MVNAWSLAASILDGTFEEDYPVMDKDDEWIEKSGGYECCLLYTSDAADE